MSDDGTAGTTAAQAATQTTGTPAGWYPDPQGAMRWWDGAAWTAHVHAGSATSVIRTATILSTEAPPQPSSNPVASRVAGVGAALQNLPQLSRRAWLVVGAVGAVLLLLAGFVLFGRGDDTPTAGPVVTPTTPQDVVKQVALSTHDLKNGLRVSVPRDGNQVTHNGDLLCGRANASQAHEVARRDVTVVTATGQPTGLENEVVAYDSAATAHAAMVELRAVLSACPHTYVRLNAHSKSLVLFSGVAVRPLTAAQGAAAGLSYDEALVVSFSVITKSPQVSAHDLTIVVRRGTVVTTMALVSPVAVTTPMVQATTALSTITVHRLPAS
jgi:Protein of unknown function (DUF2510)